MEFTLTAYFLLSGPGEFPGLIHAKCFILVNNNTNKGYYDII